MWDTLRRWRTWIFNSVCAVLLTPDLYLALTGYSWNLIIPPRWMPYVTLVILVANVMLRHRAASLPSDPDVQVKKVIEATDEPSVITIKEAGVTKAVING